MDRVRVGCVGGIVVSDGRLLMVRRGTEPAKGCWSVPGGRKEVGESDAEATVRELLEETGLLVEIGELAGSVVRDGLDGAVYEIRDYRCTLAEDSAPGDIRPGDDAVEVGWFTPAQVRELECSPGLVAELEAWGVLPGPQPAEFQRNTTGVSRS